MRYTKLGRTGLDVSVLTLGCMSWGDPARGGHPWVLDEGAARDIIRDALEAGINFFDTANEYSGGSSEEFTGRALADLARREDVVLATKVFHRMRPGPNGMGLSRKAIMHEIDASLTRLGTDYVDLYQIHRWDPTTPVEETMEALHDVVKAGKARYVGASSMYAWQFAKAQHAADRNGWTRFVSMQNHYNLLYRDEDRAVVERVAAVAAGRGVPRAQVALSWLLAQPAVTSPIVGVTKRSHLDDAVAAVDLELSTDELAELGAGYVPHAVAGHR